MTAIILSIGDELVLGQTVDTNSAWLSQQLAAVGVAVAAHMTVGDDQPGIEQAIRDTAPRCDYLIVTGGIGPTPDDLTRQALAAVMEQPLEMNETWLKHLEEFFRQRNRPMPEINKIQAMIPRGATMIFNHAGTAAGIDAKLAKIGFGVQGSENSMLNPEPRTLNPCRVFVMPGVPKEMKTMFDRSVLPIIRQNAAGSVILSKTLHTFGLGESAIAEMLGPLMDRTRNPSVGTTVANGIVSLRLNSRFDNREEAQRQLEETENACRAALGDLIFGQEDETLPQVVARLLTNPGSALSTQHSALTVTTAESCTGGLLAKMLTDIPGSSAYYHQGWVTYSNDAKSSLLGVPDELLKEHGAVSEPVVKAMAISARRTARADYSLAISGIAGPDGGTPQKPVGTVCIALAYPNRNPLPPLPQGEGRGEGPSADFPHSVLSPQSSSLCISRTFPLFGDREMVRDRAAKMALTMLRFHLMGKPLPF
jgi:nicotinamide-nucleotide amidase